MNCHGIITDTVLETGWHKGVQCCIMVTQHTKGSLVRSISMAMGKLLLKAHQAQYLFMVLMAVLIGLGGGMAAILFRYLVEGSTWSFSGGQTLNPAGFANLPWWWILLMPAVGGLIVGPVVNFLTPEARGTGVPEVMEAVALHGGHIRKRVGLFKALAVAVCLGSGGSAGREGPIVHVGAAIGSLIGKVFAVPVRNLRTFVGCGAAAGIAATFNAPIAGAMFAGEVILGRFGVVRFSAIVISSVVATVLSRHYIGDLPAFTVPSFKLIHNHELFFYSILGLAAGLVGSSFIWLMGVSRSMFEKVPIHPVFKPALGGLLVGAIALLAPAVLGVGYESINRAMHGLTPWNVLLLLLLAKLAATSLTLGSGGSGGVFAPSLFFGASLGGSIGAMLHIWLPGEVANTGSYALVGASAVVAATTRAPITAIIIIFELTNNYTIILPLMISSILATLLAGKLTPLSIYHSKLHQKGIDLEQDKDPNVLRSIRVRDVPSSPVHTLHESTALNEILNIAVSEGARHFVVEDKEGNYRGMIQLSDLRYTHLNEQELAPLIVAADLMHTDVPTLMPNESLDLAMKVFGDTDAVAVLDPEDRRKVTGVLTQDAVIEAYNRAVLDVEMVESTAGLMVYAEKAKIVDLGEHTALMELEVPPAFHNKKLKDLHLRATYDVQVVLVRTKRTGATDTGDSEGHKQVPGPDFILQSGDVMLLVGSKEGLEKIAGE